MPSFDEVKVIRKSLSDELKFLRERAAHYESSDPQSEASNHYRDEAAKVRAAIMDLDRQFLFNNSTNSTAMEA